MTESPQDLLKLATEVATEAAQLIVERRRGVVTVADTKSTATDVVTAVDRESEELIRARVLAARPDDSFLGEEGDDVHGSSGVRWVVDPIDGTVNYLYDIPTYAVSIAVELDGRTVAGVVVDAPRGETFTATLGGGAFLDGRPIEVSGCTDPAGCGVRARPQSLGLRRRGADRRGSGRAGRWPARLRRVAGDVDRRFAGHLRRPPRRAGRHRPATVLSAR
jgi:fructose-1,6-bisphosphatase/inositol monophosphatase family enzyme